MDRAMEEIREALETWRTRQQKRVEMHGKWYLVFYREPIDITGLARKHDLAPHAIERLFGVAALREDLCYPVDVVRTEFDLLRLAQSEERPITRPDRQCDSLPHRIRWQHRSAQL